MKKNLLAAVLLCAGCATVGKERAPGIDSALANPPDSFLEKAAVGPAGDGTYVVPTTQRVQSAGEVTHFPGRPVDLALSPDGKTLAVKNRTDVLFIDTRTKQIMQTLPMPKEGNSFHGICWGGDGETVWVTSAQRTLHEVLHPAEGAFTWGRHIVLPGPKKDEDSAPGGIALDDDGSIAYVALSRNNTVGVVELAVGKVVQEIPVGIAPFGILRNGSYLYVTNWGGRRPVEGDLTGPTSGSKAVVDAAGIASTGTVTVIDLQAGKTVKEIAVALHPSGMCFSPDKKCLYVANANSDVVTVIDTATNEVTASWSVKPMSELPFGSAPNAVAVSRDGATLYVANGGNNCLAALQTADGRLKGLIPTEWYPGAVLVHDGTIIVANTKGIGSRSKDVEKPGQTDYTSRDHWGSVSFIASPVGRALEKYTFTAATNMRLPMLHAALHAEDVQARVVPVPQRPGETSVFKHVLYIIKENRNYDQMLGDMPQGNGEIKFCQFGKGITPNHHALAAEFVLLDNFYCNGVLSADGHQWATEGYVTDYLEKMFGDFTRSYPYDGDDALAYASSGFIWDHVLRKGLTFRDYGEMVQAEINPDHTTWQQSYEDFVAGTGKVTTKASTKVRGLEKYIHPGYIGFPETIQDVSRAQTFVNEFREFEAKGELPNFMIMLLPNDHTSGTRPGMPTPRASVADNDLALGRIVEAVSKSSFWPETLILVAEDDPQAGVDHVDGHRSVAFCVSPYTRRGCVDSTNYTQAGLLRTMELIFGLAPMNQLTMAANPLIACFQDFPDLTPYTAKPNLIPLDEMNPPVKALRGQQRRDAVASLALPLDEPDKADENTLNRIIWHSVKGYTTPYPKLAKRVTVGKDRED